MKNHIKYVAHFLVETETPLSISSGRSGLLNDRLIARDSNELPYIPGTALAGVIRHELDQQIQDQNTKNLIRNIFGYQESNAALGSRICFSSGNLADETGEKVVEGLREIDFESDYWAIFKQLPERDHVRINERGVAANRGKFEEEILHKGARFAFEIELEGSTLDEPIWIAVLNILHQTSFRIGGGTRKGFGNLRVVYCFAKTFNLIIEEELQEYLEMSASLNKDFSDWDKFTPQYQDQGIWQQYKIRLTPRNFFLFGSGLSDQLADDLPKMEKYISWDKDSPKITDAYLIPATSIKGAISHRLAYNFNKLQGCYIEGLMANHDMEGNIASIIQDCILNRYEADNLKIFDLESLIKLEDQISKLEPFEVQENVFQKLGVKTWPVGEQNLAVKTIFGAAKDGEIGNRGNVLFSDIYLEQPISKSKYFNHVKIDRFTGGAMNSALFTQKTISVESPIDLIFYVRKSALDNVVIKAAWETTLDDLNTGRITLGGGASKGHGFFQMFI